VAHADDDTIRSADTSDAGTSPDRPASTGSDAVHAGFRRIGDYTIRREIASGGMGTVYEAQQDHPRRIVAIKVLKEGLVSRTAMRRFEYESQILARLRHPAIAHVYEAGTYRPEGEHGPVTPYFVMEYVPNARSIVDYATAKDLSVGDRLKLFADVCAAVHHGHQKGIIHRDLKPGNILIDASGFPKIIDFGVARATDSDMAVTTLQTDVGQLIGTLQYMSPEQCEADPHDLDTRSDVYALGVVLYELLCGKLPYNLTGVKIFEAARLVREERPARLSSIDVRLRGDIETIVSKALEKDRDRRYQSAAELAQDIDRYLRNEPILARPTSVFYQVRMFSRRNRTLVISAVTIAILLIAGLAGTLFGLVEARQAQTSAEAEAARARRTSTFLSEVLSMANPYVYAGGPDVKIVDMLAEAEARLDRVFHDDPVLEIELRETIASTWRNVGRYARAEESFRRAIALAEEHSGPRDALTLRLRAALGGVIGDQQRIREAEQMLRETLAAQIDALGPLNADAASTMNALGWTLYLDSREAEAEPYFARALDIRRRVLGEHDPATLKTMTNLAVTLIEQDKLDEAADPARTASTEIERALGAMHPDAIYSKHIYAWYLWSSGEFEEAYDLYEPLIRTASEVLGASHPHTLFWKRNAGRLLVDLARYEEAEGLLNRVYETSRDVLGAEDARTQDAAVSLALLYEAWAKPDQATRWRALAGADAP